MQPQTDSDYKKIFTELIKKQMIVLGPDITLAKVKNVQGVQINDQGEVTDIQGDPQALLQLLINQFVELSGAIVKKTMESIITTYPGMAGMAVGAVTNPVSVQPSVPQPAPQQTPEAQKVAVGANPFSDSYAAPVDQESQKISSDTNGVQMPKDEMETINKALSELNTSAIDSGSAQGLENKSSSVQESNSN